MCIYGIGNLMRMGRGLLDDMITNLLLTVLKQKIILGKIGMTKNVSGN